MTGLTIRPAHCEDAAALARIYNDYITNTTVTLETQPVSAAEMAARWAAIAQKGWFLVAEWAGAVLGYAYAKPWHDRDGLKYTFESSIYLAAERDLTATRGAGEALYRHLLAEMAKSGRVAVVLAVLSSENPASERFHEKLGFQRVAELANVGYKHGRWLGLVFYQHSFRPLKV